MLILNMWKEIYQNCYSVLCCQYYNSHYNLPSNIDFCNVEYSNIQSIDIQSTDIQSTDIQHTNIESTDILVCPGIVSNSDIEIEDDYDIIDDDDINI